MTVSSADSSDASRGVVVQKPKTDIYTAMLAISLVAIIVSIILLVIELGKFKWQFNAEDAKKVTLAPAAAASAPLGTAPVAVRSV